MRLAIIVSAAIVIASMKLISSPTLASTEVHDTDIPNAQRAKINREN